MSEQGLSMWTVYDSPVDFTGMYVARRFIVAAGGYYSTDDVLFGETLAQVREQLPRGLYCMPRNDHDAPPIVEVWL